MLDQTHYSRTLQKFDLTDRVAVVTGGAGLLGKEFSRTLAEAGSAVVIADQNSREATTLAKSITHSGYTAVAVTTNVSEPRSIQQMVSATLKEFGQLDILVNSAALDPKFDADQTTGLDNDPTGFDNSFENFPLEAWNEAINTNLTGAFLCCQAAARQMVAQGAGVIVNLSSIYGLTAPDQRMYQHPDRDPQYKPVYYPVTKAAVLGLTRYLATYYAGKNIRVNTLSPGGVFNNHDDEFVKAYSARAVLGRMARRDELNASLLFLVSDASSYMTGANLVVDGGWTAW